MQDQVLDGKDRLGEGLKGEEMQTSGRQLLEASIPGLGNPNAPKQVATRRPVCVGSRSGETDWESL